MKDTFIWKATKSGGVKLKKGSNLKKKQITIINSILKEDNIRYKSFINDISAYIKIIKNKSVHTYELSTEELIEVLNFDKIEINSRFSIITESDPIIIPDNLK